MMRAAFSCLLARGAESGEKGLNFDFRDFRKSLILRKTTPLPNFCNPLIIKETKKVGSRNNPLDRGKVK